jgi:hypothetical protein
MNERIKELWDQAAKTTRGDSWEEQTKFMERYTELIVKECALTAGLMEHEGRPNIGRQILDNFGVEL